MSFFDNDEDDGYPVQSRAGPSRPTRPTNRAGRAQSAVSATTSAGAGSRSFLSRLESTVSPGRPDPYGGHEYDDDMLEEEVHRAEGRLDELELDEEGAAEPDDEDESELDDVRKMGRVWVKERGTVDLMSWEGDLIDTLFDKLEQQVRWLGAHGFQSHIMLLQRTTPGRCSSLCCVKCCAKRPQCRVRLKADGAAKDGRHTPLRSADIRRRALQARTGPDRDGAGQVRHPVIRAHEATQGTSIDDTPSSACGFTSTLELDPLSWPEDVAQTRRTDARSKSTRTTLSSPPSCTRSYQAQSSPTPGGTPSSCTRTSSTLSWTPCPTGCRRWTTRTAMGYRWVSRWPVSAVGALVMLAMLTQVTKPNKNVPVLVDCRKDCGEIRLDR